MNENTQCSVLDGKFVQPCKTLQDSLNVSRNKQGVYCWDYSIHGKPSRSFYGVKSGDFSEDGVVFNFCPFCGEDISEPFSKNL